MPPPSTSSVEDSITGIFICCSCLSCCEKTARGNPLATTASGLSLTACFHAAWTLSGVPCVLICLTVQPSVFAASLRFLYSDVHAVTPQLMKSIRFPVGIGLPIGWLTGIWVGRCAHWAASLSAVVSSPFDDALLLLAVDELCRCCRRRSPPPRRWRAAQKAPRAAPVATSG